MDGTGNVLYFGPVQNRVAQSISIDSALIDPSRVMIRERAIGMENTKRIKLCVQVHGRCRHQNARFSSGAEAVWL